MEFKQWVENRYRHPVVMVFASPTVEIACRRNGLDFIQLLRPFAIHPTELYARLGDRADAITVRNFGVRLTRAQCVREAGNVQLIRHFRRLLRDNAAMGLAYGEQLDRAMSYLLKDNTYSSSSNHNDKTISSSISSRNSNSSSSSGGHHIISGGGGVVEGPRLPTQAASQLLERAHPSWHSQFIRDYVHLVRCSYFDTIDHPVGSIYAVSTSEVGGTDGVLREFREQQRLPAETRRDMPCMEDDLHSYYILLHDITAGPPLEEARRMFAAVQSRYGHANCSFLSINAVVNPHEMKNMDPSIWIDANPPSLDVPSWLAVRIEQQQQQQQQQGRSNSTGNINSNNTNNNNNSGGSGGGENNEVLTATTVIRGSSCDSANVNNSADPNTHTAKSVCSSTNSTTSTSTTLQFSEVHSIFGTWNNGVAKVTGCHMSPENVEQIRQVMLNYLSQSLFNYLERKLRALTVTVNERRSTAFSKVAAWFRGKDEGKPKSECWVIARDGGPTKYLAGSLEMQMRRAGDLSLILADYDAAVNFYRMCRNEALATLNTREFNKPIIAACQEALGVCDLLVGRLPLPSLTPWITGGTASKNSGDCRLEIAQNDYVACHVQTHALRLSLLLYEYCRTRTPPALDRGSAALLHVQRLGLTANSKLYSAVVHELLASAALFLNPPQPAGMTVPATLPNNYPVRSHIREYARHIIIAGGAYLDENLFEDSLRCYLRALRVFSGVGRNGSWELTYEHLHTVLAHLYHKLGNNIRGMAMAAIAVSMGTPMYSNPQTGLRNFESFWERQRQVMRDLGYVLCPHVVVPCVVPGSIHVSMNGFHCDEKTQKETENMSDELVEVEWRTMEEKLRSHYTDHSMSFLRHGVCWREDPAKMLLSPKHNNNKEEEEGGRGRGGKGGGGGGIRRYAMHLAEPLEITVSLRNPIGGPLKAEKLCLLYVSKQKPEQLWKSASSQTVELAAGASQTVTIAFSPGEEGTYLIIGFCWTLMGLEGYYYFATEENETSSETGDRSGNSRSSSSSNNNGNITAFEYAVNHPTPNVNSMANLEVEVGPPRAWITARLEPELPSIMRDGEYYRTSLILTNGSSHRTARGIRLQRSPQNAHIVWFDTFGLSSNMETTTTLVLDHTLEPKKSLTLPLTLQAHHSHDTSSRCKNNIFFLIGYISETPQDKELSTSLSLPTTTTTTTNTTTTITPPPYVRLHRFLRCVVVKPTLLLSAMVLPPANASMATAAVITASNVTDGRDAPVRVSRVLVIHRPLWRVMPTYVGNLLEENALDCILPPGGALSLPLSVVAVPSSSTTTTSTSTSLSIEKQQQQQEQKEKQEEEETGNVVLCQNGLMEEVCISLLSAFPSLPSKRGEVMTNIGSSVANSDMNMYFMRCSFRGPGTIGEVPTSEGLAFYLDKARGTGMKDNSTNMDKHEMEQKEVEEEKKRREKEEKHQSLLTSMIDPLTPICVAVAWVVMEDNCTYSGQLFHFIDPLEFLRPEGTLVAEAQVRTQEHLCDALIKNHSLHPRYGAVFYHVEVPYTVESTPELPDAVIIPVTMHCRSFAAYPLLVTVKTNTFAGEDSRDTLLLPSSSSSSVPVTFVGKTGCTFLLLPYETHILHFTAYAFGPGIVECNAFHLTAVALEGLSVRDDTTWRTGMSRGALLAKLEEAGKNVGDSLLENMTAINITNSSVSNSSITIMGGGGGAAATTGGGGKYSNNSFACHTKENDVGVVVNNDFHVLILGYEIAATTRAVFTHTLPDTLSTAAAIAERYKEDVKLYEKEYKVYEERRSLLCNTAKSTTHSSVDASLLVYRPLSRQVPRDLVEKMQNCIGVISIDDKHTGASSPLPRKVVNPLTEKSGTGSNNTTTTNNNNNNNNNTIDIITNTTGEESPYGFERRTAGINNSNNDDEVQAGEEMAFSPSPSQAADAFALQQREDEEEEEEKQQQEQQQQTQGGEEGNQL